MIPVLLVVVVAAALLLLKFFIRIIYNLYYHPLTKFPGPLLDRATRLAWVIQLRKGNFPFHVHELHTRYGPVVRIAPDELSFIDPQAWKDIFGHRVGANAKYPEMQKHYRFYRIHHKMPETIVNARNEKHATLRRSLAHGFSYKTLREQETIIDGYVSLLIARLKEVAKGGEPADMVSWFTWTTFDIIGDLALGSSFKCLESSNYHPYVNDFLSRRRQLDVERPDLIEGLLKREKATELSPKDTEITAGTLVIAGSKTTATVLSGVIYLLLSNPEALRKVASEVRSSFKSEEDITLTSVNSLSYMLVCLNETLRLYPPLTSGLPRQVPVDGGPICGIVVPAKTMVSVPHWAAYHSADNFKDPFSFYPERFMGDARFASDNLELLQPFSVGPRNCIGRDLSYAEMRLILARILYTFDLKLTAESGEWMERQKAFFMRRKPPLHVYLTTVKE